MMDKQSKEVKCIPFGLAVWATGVGARPLTQQLVAQLARTGARQTNRRALTTSDRLCVLGPDPSAPLTKGAPVSPAADGVWSEEDGTFHWHLLDGVYAIGDCATISQHSLMDDLGKLWDMADANGDGVLDAVEIESLFERFQLRLPGGEGGRLVSKGQQMARLFGSSEDGTLTKADFQQMLSHIDARCAGWCCLFRQSIS